MDTAIRRPALFFDRDGVLNEDRGYVYTVADFHWLPHAREAILYANTHGYRVFVVTNQSGIARGYYDVAALHALHAHMQTELHALGAHIDAFAYCPHYPKGIVPEFSCICSCRKPENGMIVDLLARYATDVQRSLLIGDKSRDIEAGRKSGLPTHLLLAGENLCRIVQEHIQKGTSKKPCARPQKS